MDEAPVAAYRDHMWEVGARKFFRMDCTARVTIRFDRLGKQVSRTFGPFGRFSCVNGVAYTDNSVFAYVDQKTGEWFCYDDGYRWSVMTVSDATG
jgi:hypothetical protein